MNVWSSATGSLKHQYSGHSGDVLFAQYNVSGSQIVSAGVDGSARIWPSIEELLPISNNLIYRQPAEFTQEEDQRFGISERDY